MTGPDERYFPGDRVGAAAPAAEMTPEQVVMKIVESARTGALALNRP
jgi:hypothetical protein